MTSDVTQDDTSEPVPRRHRESLNVEKASAEWLYDLVSDITRTGEWSPVCTSCWWDDVTEAGQVGAWFTGRNELPHRTWETRSVVVAAERGHEFAWIVGGGFVRWGFTLAHAETGTTLTESWEFLPGGIAMFEEKFGDDAPAQIADRTKQALDGIPRTLAAIKRIAESSTGAGEEAGP
ncbi:MAG: SRPBCC family protein [Nocardioides sp.]